MEVRKGADGAGSVFFEYQFDLVEFGLDGELLEAGAAGDMLADPVAAETL